MNVPPPAECPVHVCVCVCVKEKNKWKMAKEQERTIFGKNRAQKEARFESKMATAVKLTVSSTCMKESGPTKHTQTHTHTQTCRCFIIDFHTFKLSRPGSGA